MGLHCQFAGFTVEQRDRKVFELAGIAHAHIEARVDCVIRREDYDELIKPLSGRGTRFIKDPYFLCFYALVIQLNKFHQRVLQPNVSLDFFFDNHGKIGRRAIRYWDNAIALLSPEAAQLIGPAPNFRDDMDFNPLQAADLYAWIMRDRLLPKEQDTLPREILRRFADKIAIRKYIDREYLAGMKASILASKAS
jgi:hypothetical protein